MRNTSTISIFFFALALVASTTGNAQMIGRSSIGSIGAFTSNEEGVRSHSIGKMQLTNTSVEQTATGITEETPAIEFGTLNAYPNPAVGSINFSFEMPTTGDVTVSVYNEMGQKVSDVYQNNYSNGKDTQNIDLTNYAAGIYFITLNFTSSNDGQLHTISKKIQVLN